MLHPDNPSNGDVCNNYDLFGKNDDSVLPQSQRLTLTQRMERAVYLGLDKKHYGKIVAGEKIITYEVNRNVKKAKKIYRRWLGCLGRR